MPAYPQTRSNNRPDITAPGDDRAASNVLNDKVRHAPCPGVVEEQHHAAGNDQHPAKASEIPMGQSGAPARYDWNAFAGAVARRVHDEGMPASQGELVRDMLDWFATSGAVPDESTVRRRVQVLWAALTRKNTG